MSRLAEAMAAVETRIQSRPSKNWKDELSDWMHPSAFRERTNHICYSIPRKVFFRLAGLSVRLIMISFDFKLLRVAV